MNPFPVRSNVDRPIRLLTLNMIIAPNLIMLMRLCPRFIFRLSAHTAKIAKTLVTILVAFASCLLSLFNQPSSQLQLSLKLFLGRQIKHVFGREEALAFVQHGISGDGFVFLCAENKTNGRIVPLCEVFVIEHPDIAVHLADILMRQFADLEVNQKVAFQNAVLKNQIDIKVVVVELHAFLTTDKSEALAKFK